MATANVGYRGRWGSTSIGTIATNVSDMVPHVTGMLELVREYNTQTVSDTETSLWIDEPTTSRIATFAKLDLSALDTGDVFVIREYYKLEDGGSYIKFNELTYSDAQDPAGKKIELLPYRYGAKLTGQKTAGTDRNINVEVFILE